MSRIYRINVSVDTARATDHRHPLTGGIAFVVRADSPDDATRYLAGPNGHAYGEGGRIVLHEFRVVSVKATAARRWLQVGRTPVVVETALSPVAAGGGGGGGSGGGAQMGSMQRLPADPVTLYANTAARCRCQSTITLRTDGIWWHGARQGIYCREGSR